MIVVDLEMSGMNYEKCGIVEIGAIDLDSREEFREIARLDGGEVVISEPGLDHSVLEILGMSEEQLRDKNKQSQKDMLQHFFEWCKKTKTKNFICLHPHADIAFLEHKAKKYSLKFPFVSYKVFDLHSIAQIIYFKLNKNFSFEEKKGQLSSALGLKSILKFVGMKDNRKIHNALEDSKLTAEAFSRLVYGKNLLEEYSKFKLPENIKQ
jgi:DNA polymerase III epsilon subunit-like protein